MSELPQTEAIDPAGNDLDKLGTVDLVGYLAGAQRSAVDAVAARGAEIASVVDAIVERIQRGGRLHYVGAGTSGRLGVLDASEMPPTFGTNPSLVCAHIAGGNDALRKSVEGAEDDGDAGEFAIYGHVAEDDVVIGISASGGAPYVARALGAAESLGALTVAIVNSGGSPLEAAVRNAIVLDTGAEPVAGSTRLKAGTAQKIALNTISTAVMIKLGKTYGNLMVDVVASNRKLRDRALRLVEKIADVDRARATALLDAAKGSAKVAIVMAWRGVDADGARAALDNVRGRLRALK
jgi:N-acetylmuramic acid 6-phosphate etherase